MSNLIMSIICRHSPFKCVLNANIKKEAFREKKRIDLRFDSKSFNKNNNNKNVNNTVFCLYFML